MSVGRGEPYSSGVAGQYRAFHLEDTGLNPVELVEGDSLSHVQHQRSH